MTQTVQTNPVDALIPVIVQAVYEWRKENSDEKLKNRVKHMLDKSSEEIVIKLLGFKKDYAGKWELDHCNGRSGESAAGDFFRKAHAEAVQEWLAGIDMPTLSPSLKAKLQREAQREYADHLAYALQERARSQAAADANALISGITHSNQIDQYLKMHSLLQATPM